MKATRPYKGLKRGRLTPISKKHMEAYRAYLKLRHDYIQQHPICEVCGEHLTQDIHHKAKRRVNLNKTETWLAVCRACHTRIEEHKGWAREMGYLV